MTDLRTQVGSYLAPKPAVRPGFEHSTLTEEQKRMKEALKQLFDDTTEEGGNPLSKLGALLSDNETFGHYQTPMNALGITFDNNFPMDNAEEGLQTVLKEAQMDPTKAKGRIAIGPETMKAERTDTVPHELMHKASKFLKEAYPGNSKTDIIDHAVIPSAMINENIEAKENERYLEYMFPKQGLKARSLGEIEQKGIYPLALKEIKKRLKRRPTQ